MVAVQSGCWTGADVIQCGYSGSYYTSDNPDLPAALVKLRTPVTLDRRNTLYFLHRLSLVVISSILWPSRASQIGKTQDSRTSMFPLPFIGTGPSGRTWHRDPTCIQASLVR